MKNLFKIFLFLFLGLFLFSCSNKDLNNDKAVINPETNTNIDNSSNENSDNIPEKIISPPENKEPEENTVNKNLEESKETTENNEPTVSTETSNEVTSTIVPNVKIYYYDVINDKIIYITRNITIKNKAVAKALVNELKNSPNENIQHSINEKIDIISAKVIKEEDLVILNFTDNFVSAQNLGSGPESMTLKAITNTFGNYFSVNNVKIIINGKPYSSGHISFNENDSFKVDLNNTTELIK